jgi:uncharacterized RDD family membrane protein YckC
MRVYETPDALPMAWPMTDRLTEGVLWRRLAAWLLDVVVVGLLTAVLWGVLMVFGLLTLGLGFPLLGLLPLVPFLYHVGFLAGSGAATPGQAAFGLVVVRNDDFGRPELLQAIVFTLLFYLTLAVAFVLLAVALFTPRHRTLHDLGSGLVVVRRRALIANAPMARSAMARAAMTRH